MVSVHYQGNKQTLEPIPRVLARADQALQILGRYKSRLDGVTERVVGARSRRPRDACATSSPCCSAPRWCGASPKRSRATSSSSASTAGSSSCSSKSSPAASKKTCASSCKDYFVESAEWVLAQVTARLADITDDELLDLRFVSALLHLSAEIDLDSSLQPRGYRLALEDPAAARAHRRARRRALRHAAQDHARQHRRPRRGRRSRRSARTRDQGRVVAGCRDFDPRPVRVSPRRLCEGRDARSAHRLAFGEPHPPPRFAPGRTPSHVLTLVVD